MGVFPLNEPKLNTKRGSILQPKQNVEVYHRLFNTFPMIKTFESGLSNLSAKKGNF